MYKVKQFLDKKSLLALYYSDIHSYPDYAYLAFYFSNESEKTAQPTKTGYSNSP